MNTENKLKIDDFTKALAECINQAQGNVVDPMVLAETWKGELIKLAKSEEPVSEEMEEAIDKSFIYHENRGDDFRSDKQIETAYRCGFETGAKWKEEQFEKNRLKHCNSITNEQAELEQDFIDQHLDKHQRMPTFLDAIEYGMNLQKEQFEKDCANLCKGIATAKGLAVAMAYNKGMDDAKEQIMASATDVTVHEDAGGYPYIPQMELYDNDNDVPLAKEGDKYKVVLIKGD